MKTVSLSGSPRENVGKKDAAQLRREGRVPGVLYGGDQQLHFSVLENDLNKLIYTPDVYMIQLELDGTTYNTIIQEMQFHPVTDRALHADFLQLFDDKVAKVKLPVRLTGNSPGVRAGGKLRQNYRRLTTQGLPNALPEAIEVDISELRIGMSVRVRDLNIEGCEILEAPGSVVAAVKTARGAVAGDDEEEGEEDSAEGGEE